MHYIISTVQILTIYSLILNVECCIRTVPSDEVTLPPPTDLTTEFTDPTEETTTDAEQTDSTVNEMTTGTTEAEEPTTTQPMQSTTTTAIPTTTELMCSLTCEEPVYGMNYDWSQAESTYEDCTFYNGYDPTTDNTLVDPIVTIISSTETRCSIQLTCPDSNPFPVHIFHNDNQSARCVKSTIADGFLTLHCDQDGGIYRYRGSGGRYYAAACSAMPNPQPG